MVTGSPPGNGGDKWDMKGAFDILDRLPVRISIPDPWQQQAIRSLVEGRDVILNAPTGAGKTFVFESLIRGRTLGAGQQAVYTVPTRALANDKWREWRAAGWKAGIATGDLAENLDAPVLVATLETQRERLLAGHGPRLLVIDEYQMIGDERRGLNYELAIALAPPTTQLLLLSGSVSNPADVAAWFGRLGRNVEVIETRQRPVPLDDIPLGALPDQAPKRVRNFWQRLALGVLLSDFGPLLIFAPQRRSAEKIARKIAEALPDDDPIELSDPAL
ncbi:MAG: DEAD/DEAH box helicase, partial [Verrucomicrobiae bacterium]|nr:DEAD/DEAH box helicase [Verrucomicrobiae bacterium]